MYKATYKDIQNLIKWGAEHDDINAMIMAGYQPQGHVYAYYQPSSVNWAWQIGLYTIDGTLYELVTRFGSVEGGRVVYQHDNTFGEY